MTSKTCSKCGEVKPLDGFHKRAASRDGRKSQCKECVSARMRDYNVENRALIAERVHSRYIANREVILSRDSRYRAVNKDRIRERNTGYYWDNREQIRAQQSEYFADNPHIGWESSHRERALKYGFGHLIPSMQKVTREDLIRIHGDRCKHCNGPFESADHWPIPVSQGGMHGIWNLVPSCMDCQRRTWRAYKPSSTAHNNTTITEDRN